MIKQIVTSASIGAWEAKLEIITNYRPMDLKTDIRAQREVSFPITDNDNNNR